MEVARKGYLQPFEEPWWQGRAFQLCAREFQKRHHRSIFLGDKGVGKTSEILSLFEDVADTIPGFTVVVLTTGRGMHAYIRDIAKFPNHADKFQVITGDKATRRTQWRNNSARYFICTYQTFLSDTGVRGEGSDRIIPTWCPYQVDAFVLSEFHRVVRSRKSKMFHLLKQYTKDTPWMVFESGSGVSKGPEDLWPALHLADPKFWSTYWGYVRTWCEIEETGFGKSVKGPKRDPKTGWPDEAQADRWRKAVSPYVFNVRAEDIPGEMPPITNDPLRYDLPAWQKELHDSLLQDQIAEAPNGEWIFSANRLTNLFKIRTALICPKALNPEFGYGGGIEAIADDIEESELSGYVLFTPFRAPIRYLDEYLRERDHQVFILQGGIRPSEQSTILSQFHDAQRNQDGHPAGLISTIKFAESWEVPFTRYGYFLGYEYDHEDNDQARKRLRRLISPRPVYIQWAIGNGTYDEDFIALLMEKKEGKDALEAAFKRARDKAYG